MASLNFRAINKGAGGRRRLSVWHYISWTEYLQSQFKLFSSSWGIPCQGATANSVSSSEVSLQASSKTEEHILRSSSLCIYHLLIVTPTPPCFFLFLLRWEKVKHHYTKYTGNIVCDSISCWYLIGLCRDMLVIWDVYWIYTRGNVNLAGTFRSYVWLLLYCKIHTNGALFHPNTRVYTNTDCAGFHIYIHKPLGVLLSINSVGGHVACSFFSLPAVRQ